LTTAAPGDPGPDCGPAGTARLARPFLHPPPTTSARRASLPAEQIRDLHQRGHIIGSHSCSHPKRMSFCSRAELLQEWGRSCEILAGILGAPVTVASVPGGFYSRAVAEAAAEAGIPRPVQFRADHAAANGGWLPGAGTLLPFIGACRPGPPPPSPRKSAAAPAAKCSLESEESGQGAGWPGLPVSARTLPARKYANHD